MKTGATTKSVMHDIGFVLIATIILIVLSLLIFPLFIALLPLLLIVGCKEIWYLDHIKNNP